MDSCCICISNRKNSRLFPFFEIDTKTSMSYAAMLFFLTNIKINEDSTNMMCRSCTNHLRTAYEFKKKVLESEFIVSSETKDVLNASKKYFNTIEELKIELKINDDHQKSTASVLADDFVKKLQNNNVTIEKLAIPSETKLILNGTKRIPILDFLQIIENSEELDQDHEDLGQDYDMGASDFISDRSDNEYCVPLAERIKNKKNSKKRKKNKNVPEESLSDQDYVMDDSDNGSDDDYIENLKKRKEKQQKLQKSKKQSNQKNVTLQSMCIKPVIMKHLETVKSKIERTETEKKMRAKREKLKEICPYCGISVTSLKNHIRQHTATKDFHCDKCEKKFFTQIELTRHERSFHLFAKQFKCELCPAAFDILASLRSHGYVHKEEKNYACPMCAKTFKRQRNLNYHIKRHNSANQTIACEECKLTFFGKDKLRHHMRVHTGERPYCCELCNQPYSYKHDFTRHCLKKHGVFIMRRKLTVMNELVLKKEKIITRELLAMTQGNGGNIHEREEFKGADGILALTIAMKYLKKEETLKYIDKEFLFT